MFRHVASQFRKPLSRPTFDTRFVKSFLYKRNVARRKINYNTLKLLRFNATQPVSPSSPNPHDVFLSTKSGVIRSCSHVKILKSSSMLSRLSFIFISHLIKHITSQTY